jgi:hypothetical protein
MFKGVSICFRGRSVDIQLLTAVSESRCFNQYCIRMKSRVTKFMLFDYRTLQYFYLVTQRHSATMYSTIHANHSSDTADDHFDFFLGISYGWFLSALSSSQEAPSIKPHIVSPVSRNVTVQQFTSLPPTRLVKLVTPLSSFLGFHLAGCWVCYSLHSLLRGSRSHFVCED